MIEVSDTPVILDGGLATELESRGLTIATALWSAELLRSNPGAIRDSHRAFLEAGAQIITSASYQASRAGFHQLGVGAAEADRLISSSVSLAKSAIAEYLPGKTQDSVLKVAASVGPYGAVLADGSEYRGNYGVSKVVIQQFHEPRLAVLDNAGADLLAVETIPSLDEAEVLAELLADCNTPAWVSFTCRDAQRLRDGNDVAIAAALFHHNPNVVAVGVNCTAPEYVGELLGRIREAAPAKLLIAYPNSGETWDARARRWSGDWNPETFVAAAGEWLAAGAGIIGGCCRILPKHIAALSESISRLHC